MTSFNVDLGELEKERKFVTVISELEMKVNQMEYFLQKCCENDMYDKLLSLIHIYYGLKENTVAKNLSLYLYVAKTLLFSTKVCYCSQH